MKWFRRLPSRWEHHLKYERHPFGRIEEFVDVRRTTITVKKERTVVCLNIPLINLKIREEVFYYIFVQYEFRDGRFGGVAALKVEVDELTETIVRCYSNPPIAYWVQAAKKKQEAVAPCFYSFISEVGRF